MKNIHLQYYINYLVWLGNKTQTVFNELSRLKVAYRNRSSIMLARRVQIRNKL